MGGPAFGCCERVYESQRGRVFPSLLEDASEGSCGACVQLWEELSRYLPKWLHHLAFPLGCEF